MPMYNLIEHSDAYLKRSKSLWKYYREEPVLDSNRNIIDFPDDNNNSALFKLEQKITGQTGNGDTIFVKIMVLLKYLSNFWRTLEMSLVNCEISLQLKCCRSWIIVAGTENNQNWIFQIYDTKVYFSAVTLSTQENIELLQQLESSFKKNKLLEQISS